MTDAIIHRGPDDHGYYYGPGIALGHRRLAILDLSESGRQPMEYMGRYVITYNGEIYNYIEIRQILESEGYTFKSRTDTEVIMAAYDKWGAECVKQFNGMWAFAIYDKLKNIVFCCRDRFGVKPFYYWVAPNGAFCFGSEIKQFTTFPGWKARVNPQRAYDYLVYGITNHTDETLFKNVYELEKGCLMSLPVNNIKFGEYGRHPATRWYELPSKIFTGRLEEAETDLKDLLIDSITLRLRADVSIGSCLSGGLDSSSIVCIVNALLREEGSASLQKTFSACSEVEQFNEKKWADMVVNATGVDAHFVYPTMENLFTNLPSITWHQDEPFNEPAIYAQWCVFQLAAGNKTKVLLDGQGADEILAGYASFFPARFAGLLMSGKLFNLWEEINTTRELHGISRMRSLLNVGKVLLPNALKKPFLEIFGGHNPSPEWLNLDVLKASPVNPYLRLSGYIFNIQAMSKIELLSAHLPTLLHWEDRNSMAHSLESRCPFLDYRVVEFTLGLPDEYKLSNGVTKLVLRNAMNGILPDSIRERRDKKGFMTPEEVWIKKTGPALFRKRAKRAIKASDGILNHKCLQKVEDIISGDQEFSSVSWRLINFGQWMETFNVSAS